MTSSTHAAKINPFRYRGYYYDEETGLYYLNSRYYDPVVKRFINADAAELALSATASPTYNENLFAYCDNNPVSRIDTDGDIWGVIIGAILVGGLLGGAFEGVAQLASGTEWSELDWWAIGKETVNGMAVGGVFGIGAAIPGSQAFVAAGLSFVGVTSSAEHSMDNGDSAIMTVLKATGSMLMPYLTTYKGTLANKAGDILLKESSNSHLSKALKDGIHVMVDFAESTLRDAPAVTVNNVIKKVGKNRGIRAGLRYIWEVLFG